MANTGEEKRRKQKPKPKPVCVDQGVGKPDISTAWCMPLLLVKEQQSTKAQRFSAENLPYIFPWVFDQVLF